MTKNPIYVFTLDDMPKLYFGTMDDIDGLIRSVRKGIIPCPPMREAIKVLDIQTSHKGVSQVLNDRSWFYKNDHGQVLDLHADRVEIQQIAIRYDGYFHRCMKAKFINLSVTAEFTSEKQIPVDCLSGNPLTFITDFSDKDNRIIESRFFVSEDSYNKVGEARERMAEQHISFDSLMEDIFGEN